MEFSGPIWIPARLFINLANWAFVFAVPVLYGAIYKFRKAHAVTTIGGKSHPFNFGKIIHSIFSFPPFFQSLLTLLFISKWLLQVKRKTHQHYCIKILVMFSFFLVVVVVVCHVSSSKGMKFDTTDTDINRKMRSNALCNTKVVLKLSWTQPPHKQLLVGGTSRREVPTDKAVLGVGCDTRVKDPTINHNSGISEKERQKYIFACNTLVQA